MTQLQNCKGSIDSAQMVVSQLVSFQAETKSSCIQRLHFAEARNKLGKNMYGIVKSCESQALNPRPYEGSLTTYH